jgi:L-cysteine S-thiosulfotransferase
VKHAVLAVLLPLTALPFTSLSYSADAENGRRIALGKMDGNCLLCHAIPGADRPAGNIGPSLSGVGAKYSRNELRERIVDASRFNAKSVMPPYGRTDGLHEVAAQYRGKPVLTAAEIDDLVAFLATLK